MPRLDLRAIDVAFIAIVLGAASTLYTKFLITNPAAAYAAVAVFGSIAALILWHSTHTVAWISSFHITHYDARKDTLVRPQRKAGHDIPCPYPDAWYCVAFTQELRPGEVKDLVVCNQNLIVFRPQLKPGQTAWPAAAVLDAYCTHLGAHLALGGGRVEGDCVRCPFHGWCFDASGKLTSTPSGDCPPGSDIRAWPVMEKNGVIAVWMSSTVHKDPAILRQVIRPVNAAKVATEASGTAAKHHETEQKTLEELSQLASTATAVPSNKPWFAIPDMPALHTPEPGQEAQLVYHGCTENIVHSVLWENPENGADVAHLNALHAEFIIPALYPFLSHRWSASWSVRDVRPEIADIDLKEAMVLLKYVVLPGEVSVHITQCGPSQVFIDMLTPVGHCIVIETVTPVSPRQQRVMHALYASRATPRIFAKAILFSVMAQYEKDVPIWCNKVYAPRPALVKHDPAIAAYRRWRNRFIQPGAISYREAVQAHVADQLGLPADASLDW